MQQVSTWDLNHIIPVVQNFSAEAVGAFVVSINADVNGYSWTITSDTGSDVGFGDGYYGENDA
jgi:hypothetical protein